MEIGEEELRKFIEQISAVTALEREEVVELLINFERHYKRIGMPSKSETYEEWEASD